MERREFMNSILLGSGALFISGKSNALEFYPSGQDRKWAVLYGTRYGSTRDAAVWISEGMSAVADVFDAREEPDLIGYEHIIVGSGIYGGECAESLKSYLTENVESFHSRIRGVFVVCGQGAEGAANYLPPLVELCKADSPLTISFPGRVTTRLFEPEVAERMKSFYERTGRTYEDTDNLARIDCLDFGKKVFDSFDKS